MSISGNRTEILNYDGGGRWGDLGMMWPSIWEQRYRRIKVQGGQKKATDFGEALVMGRPGWYPAVSQSLVTIFPHYHMGLTIVSLVLSLTHSSVLLCLPFTPAAATWLEWVLSMVHADLCSWSEDSNMVDIKCCGLLELWLNNCFQRIRTGILELLMDWRMKDCIVFWHSFQFWVGG